MAAVDIVLPAHNEADSIETTLREFHEVVALGAGIDIRFVVCEDGSSDGTAEVVRSLQSELPIKLLTGPERKGYSRAVVDGLRATDRDLVAFIDSDGQCDPADFPQLLALIDDADLVVGYRAPRQDHWVRLVMSKAFKTFYRLLFPVPVKDPSCPYLIIHRPALERILRGDLGILKQGFWWEFLARAVAEDLRIVEHPVRHRVRTSGTTQVYKPGKVPGIAAAHLLGLLQLRRELRTLRAQA
jgi:glycosyltransferase involved in cell wall biosynthesis